MSNQLQHSELEGRRILIAGAGGQVGIALQKIMPTGVKILALDSKALDITDSSSVNDTVARFKPDWIINAAAYTAVDKAESEPEKAFSINRDGAANLARTAESISARMVQISTDYVFDGSQARPYKPDDAVNPINVYGESKLAGEIASRDVLGDNLLIIRTAWVYASHGNNFFTSMLRYMQDKKELKIVEDQIGTPTNAFSLAETIYSSIKSEVTGTYHWTDAGVASWYDFACCIYRLGRLNGMIDSECNIIPILSCQYNTLAKRPSYSVLDKSEIRCKLGLKKIQHWQYLLNSAWL